MYAAALLALLALAQTDQTVQVQKGTRLELSNVAGDVVIRGWDRDAVRVEAEHSERDSVEIRPLDQRLLIRGRSRTGNVRSLDYTITVPKWMAVRVMGTYSDVTIDGVGGEVNVETSRGDINVNGGSGFISLKSVQGEISLRNATGRVDITSVNDGIHVADVNGDVSAETTNGSIILERIDSANADVYTVNGNVAYDGPIRDKGSYRLTTHNGTISMALPDKANLTMSVRTYNGGFRSTFPVKQDDSGTRKRFSLTFGNGSARVELESFNGSIALRRPGEAAFPSRTRRDRR